MEFSNTKKKFGVPTKILHWAIFALFVSQYFLVYRREYFADTNPDKLQYILLHKAFGLIILTLGILMILWRQVGQRPDMPVNMTPYQNLLAKCVHTLLYLSMLVMPLSGLGMSLWNGYSVSFFGLFTIPSFTKNPLIGDTLYVTHVWSSYVIIGLVILHVLGALYHYLYKRDQVMQRMF